MFLMLGSLKPIKNHYHHHHHIIIIIINIMRDVKLDWNYQIMRLVYLHKEAGKGSNKETGQ